MTSPHPWLNRILACIGSPKAQRANTDALAQRAAEAGDIGTAQIPRRMKLEGMERHRDALEAAHWLPTAAASNEAAPDDPVRPALRRQVAKPDQRAVAARLREAAEDGVVAAQFKLGLCFAEGIGVERNKAAAQSWYLRAAALGHPAARLRLERLPENA